MTEENCRRNASEELARADDCLREARTLMDAGLPYGAASRAYYAVFHAARALLFSVGIEPRSHKALVSLIGEHFVRAGRLSPALGRTVSRLQRDQEDADYATGAVFTRDEVSPILDEAARFVEAARHLIASSP